MTIEDDVPEITWDELNRLEADRDAARADCDKTQKVLELERQARQVREDELKEEIARLKEVHLHGCECSTDEACQFVKERDRALALLRRCKQWFDARPRRERPTPLADDINEVLP